MTTLQQGAPQAASEETRLVLAGRGWDGWTPALEMLAALPYVCTRATSPANSGPTAAPENTVVLYSPGDDVAEAAAQMQALRNDPSHAPTLLCVASDNMGALSLAELGDDFVLVPCPPGELDKRVRRLLRPGNEDEEVLRLGHLVLDSATHEAVLSGERIKLARMEFRLLWCLAQRAGRIYPRARLIEAVWGREYAGSDRTLDVHIRRLRHKLGDFGGQRLKTVLNIGYGLMGATDS